MLEIILQASLGFDAKKTKKLLKKHGILGRCTLNLPANCHIPFYLEKVTAIIKSAVDKVETLEWWCSRLRSN